MCRASDRVRRFVREARRIEPADEQQQGRRGLAGVRLELRARRVLEARVQLHDLVLSWPARATAF
jgi:hypothetical protein